MKIYCSDVGSDASCTMSYDSTETSWSCNGGNNECILPTAAPIEGSGFPTESPTTARPTSAPTTKIPSQAPIPTFTMYPTNIPTISKSPTNMMQTETTNNNNGGGSSSNANNNNSDESDAGAIAATMIVLFLILGCCVGLGVLYRKHDKSRAMMKQMYIGMIGIAKKSGNEAEEEREGYGYNEHLPNESNAQLTPQGKSEDEYNKINIEYAVASQSGQTTRTQSPNSTTGSQMNKYKHKLKIINDANDANAKQPPPNVWTRVGTGPDSVGLVK